MPTSRTSLLFAVIALATLTVAGAHAEQPQGLYLQLQPSGTAFVYYYYYFWTDGRICHGLPTGGIDREPADFAALQKQLKCGRYTIAGNRMALEWPDEKSYSATLVNVKKDGFEMNGYNTAKTGSYGAGQRLTGSYSGTIVGAQMRSVTYVFRPDGTFQLNDKPVTSLDGAPLTSSGTYRLFANTLELTSPSGTVRRTVYPFPSGGMMVEGTVIKP